MSERLQELLLRFLSGENEFEGDCETIRKFLLLVEALGRKGKIEKINDNLCSLIVEYSRAS
ncbi:hypothetical protein KN1_17420 [Stygiolobus caldivivus]|uniref:Uncharacterized protein n=1 Tax=Stygiolobus caldivivus TaxID=2824673 RepID=A0A8D5U7F2_9CREN|nr:hypothetical protein KN1_17420 [Stygiolobus caldivivus]